MRRMIILSCVVGLLWLVPVAVDAAGPPAKKAAPQAKIATGLVSKLAGVGVGYQHDPPISPHQPGKKLKILVCQILKQKFSIPCKA